MPQITVPAEARPDVGRYVVYVAVGFFLVGTITGLFANNATNPIVSVLAISVAALLNIGILLLVVQSMVERYFEAAEVVETGRRETAD